MPGRSRPVRGPQDRHPRAGGSRNGRTVIEERAQRRLSDITEAIAAIRSHLERGDISDGLVFDAVRIRLLEIGEAVKSLPQEFTSAEPDIPWRQIARMRDRLAHRYFDTSHAIVAATIEHDLPALAAAVERLRNRDY